MNKRIKFQKTLIVIFGFIAALLIVALFVGRNDTVTVMVINSDKIDLTKPIGKQMNLFAQEEISKSDFNKFKGSLVTGFQTNDTRYLKDKYAIGTPLTVSMLEDGKRAGTFAQSTAALHTTFNIPNSISSLPAGLDSGDLVDIFLYVEAIDDKIIENATSSDNQEDAEPDATTEEENEDDPTDEDALSTNGNTESSTNPTEYKNLENSVNLLLSNVKVSSMNETSINVSVSQTQYNILYVAQKMGQFVIHLPGQKDVQSCKDVYANLEKSYKSSLLDLKDSTEFKKQTEEERLASIRSLKNSYEYNIHNAECISNADKIDSLTSAEILKKFSSGESFDAILSTSDYADQFLKNSLSNSDDEIDTKDILNNTEDTIDTILSGKTEDETTTKKETTKKEDTETKENETTKKEDTKTKENETTTKKENTTKVEDASKKEVNYSSEDDDVFNSLK